MAKTGRIASGGVHQSSNALIGAAIIHLVPGLLYWSLYGFNFDLNDCIYSGGFALLMLMAIWARWSPLVPSLVCAALYVVLLSLQVRAIANWNLITWIIQASIIILIGIAVYSAVKHRNGEPNRTS